MNQPLIAVIGATGLQGGAVVRALQATQRYRVRALTRRPEKHPDLAYEVVRADLDDPSSLRDAFAGAWGAFVVTNFWDRGGKDELSQGTAAVAAAREAGVQHFVWSTLPDVEAISAGRFSVPHFSGKARVDPVVTKAGFRHWTFVEPPFYFQNFAGQMSPQDLGDGKRGWSLPIDPVRRCIHMGDITELGNLVAGAFDRPADVGAGQRLSLCGDLLSFNDVVETLNAQGHQLSFRPMPREVFASLFPGAAEMAATLGYFEGYTYFGPAADQKIALAERTTVRPFTSFSDWAKVHMPAQESRP